MTHSRACTKIKHKDKATADAVIRRLLFREKQKPSKMRCGFLTSYECKRCAAWHVGHNKGKGSIIKFIDKVMAADLDRKREYQTC